MPKKQCPQEGGEVEREGTEANVASLHLLFISSMLPSSPSFYLSPAPAPALPLPFLPRRHACAPRGKRESDERAKGEGRRKESFSLEI